MTATNLKCPNCNKVALYARIDGTLRCARCGCVVPAMISEKPVPVEQPSEGKR